MTDNGRLAGPTGDARRPAARTPADERPAAGDNVEDHGPALERLKNKNGGLDFLVAALMGAEEVAKWYDDEPAMRRAITTAVNEALSARLRTTVRLRECRRGHEVTKAQQSPTSNATPERNSRR